MRFDELFFLLDVLRNLVKDDRFACLPTQRQLVQTCVELLQVPRLVQLDVRLVALLDQILETCEGLLAQLYLRRIRQLEWLLVAVQVDELEAPCRAAQFD